MKVRLCVSSTVLLILSTVLPVVSVDSLRNGISTELDAATDNVPSNQDLLALSKVTTQGTLDAPVDGKDGKPHYGPWVDTNTGGDRKEGIDSDGKTMAVASSTESSSSVARIGPDGTPISPSKDGVMDDPYRQSPKEGTRGTDGRVSEKSKDKSAGEKAPETPKDPPPLPLSEQRKLSEMKDTSAESADARTPSKDQILEKPQDLPDKPHNIPPPKSPMPMKDDPLALDPLPSTVTKSLSSHDPGSALEGKVISPVHSLVLSLAMILFSEIGDKTFLVAALMAMRHPRLLVFFAAFSALAAMTVLSALLGHAVPTFIPATFTKFLAAGLFFIFGGRMFTEGRAMSPDSGVSEEMKEVEMELEEKEHQQRRMSRRRPSINPYLLEAGRAGNSRKSRSANRLPSPPSSISSSSSRESSPTREPSWQNALAGLGNLCSFLLSPAWVQTFVMTFLGEWGDRSQIATIAMAAGQDYWWVTVGAITGHALCTAAAVIGGRAIAGRVSLRTVTLGGSFAFVIFGVIYFIEAISIS